MKSPPSIKLWVECINATPITTPTQGVVIGVVLIECEVTAAVLYGCRSFVGLLKQSNNSVVNTNKNLQKPSNRLNIAYSNSGD